MNFYSSDEYLAAAAEAYFPGRQARAENVRIGHEVLRLLVIDRHEVATTLPFLDYHAPLRRDQAPDVSRVHGYAENVVREVVRREDWSQIATSTEVAPHLDWSLFPNYEDYKAYLLQHAKGIIRDQERRRRRLAEQVGELEFCVDDRRPDVMPFARQWKSRQWKETGHKDLFEDPRNIRFFDVMRERGLLMCSTLRGGEHILSVWVGFIYDGVWSGWIFTYDHELRKYSVGHQLLHSMLQESHRRKLREFDFSIGNEDYKWLYSTHARILGSVGRAPVHRRLALGAREQTTKLLSLHPRGMELARSMRTRLRKHGWI